MSRPGDFLLDPEQYALALGQPVRVPIGTTRAPRVIVFKEAGTLRWAAFRTAARHPQLTPILKPSNPPEQVMAFAITVHPPLWEES